MADRASTQERARRFDLFDPALKEGDPYPLYADLREHCPVAHSQAFGGHWVFSTYEDIFNALRNPTDYSSRQTSLATGPINSGGPIPIQIDPPDHAKYRRILAEHFSMPRMRKLEPAVREVSVRRLEPIAKAGRCEFVDEFAIALPAEVFLHLMGLPLEDLSRFLPWVHSSNREGLSDDPEAQRHQAEVTMPAIRGYFQDVINARRSWKEQPDDVMGVLMTARFDDARPLTDDEILRTCNLLLLAGLDTTTTVLSNAVEFLATHPEHKSQLIREPSKIPAAVEELMRFEALVSQARVLNRDVEVRGQKLRAGDRVLMLQGSACRDPEQFPNPDVVDFERRGASRHLGFGAGPHRCLGMHLARLELCVALEEIHRLIPSYRIPEGEKVGRHLGVVKGVDRLPLVFDA